MKYKVVIYESSKYIFDEIEADSPEEAEDIAYRDESFVRSNPDETDSFVTVSELED